MFKPIMCKVLMKKFKMFIFERLNCFGLVCGVAEFKSVFKITVQEAPDNV